MSGHRRRGVVPRRRRRDEEGEDESSTAGDLDDLSVSEGSAISNVDEDADIEGSDVSEEDEESRSLPGDEKTMDTARRQRVVPSAEPRDRTTNLKTANLKKTKSGPRVANGTVESRKSPLPDKSAPSEVLKTDNNAAVQTISSLPHVEQSHETPAEQARRDRLEYLKQKNSDPAFVPNRGGFFLHDDRSAGPPLSSYGRPFHRGRGRGYNGGYGIGRGYPSAVAGPTGQQWAHDLHDTVNKVAVSPPVKDTSALLPVPTAKPATTAPNRTFSVSTVLGNVTVQVYLPGMTSKKTFQNLVKKQHTLLPQHRPPLRRDKPVRISIPNEDPRYIFPSTERSFIFIPRAMRPNQQAYPRGRGRGSFHGSRRTSIIGSVYTPSIAMSRRSSLGGMASNGVQTPVTATLPRGPMMPTYNRPVVRMPGPVVPVVGMIPTPMPLAIPVNNMLPSEGASHTPAILQSPTVALPMHQPRPQKTVSVAEIESPAVKAPQQQQEQPFHQQMPPGVSLTDGAGLPHNQHQPTVSIGTPLSHIPEGAVYAQPFQPYPMYPQDTYYGSGFSGAGMVYQPSAEAFGMGMGGPVMPPQFPQGTNFVPLPHVNDAGSQTGALAHESNGMVYYYDPSQYGIDGSQMAHYPMAVGGGVMGMPAAGPYFYPAMPNGMFYPATQ